MVKRIYEYLGKRPSRGIYTEGKSEPHFLKNLNVRKMKFPGQMLDYYEGSVRQYLPNAPKELGKPVWIWIFVDASFASDKKDRKSVTGMLIYVGDMAFKWYSKRQKSIASSTYGSEFVALRHATEEAMSILITLQSLGVPVAGCRIFCDMKEYSPVQHYQATN